MLGLKHDYNVLVEYDPAWPVLFEQEKARLQAVLPHFSYTIEHCGSTAVPGLRAKPILDMLIGIVPLTDWIHYTSPLEGLGYDYAEHAGVSGHYIFGRGRTESERTHLIHVVELHGHAWQFNVAFRNALRTNRPLREEYARVKHAASASAPEGRARYNILKSAFFEKVNLGYLTSLEESC